MILKHTLAVLVGTLFLLDPSTSEAQINITELGRYDYQAARIAISAIFGDTRMKKGMNTPL